MFEGDLDDGELEIGQVSGLIRDIPTCAVLVSRLLVEYEDAVRALPLTL
jgi:enoyl-[acyl-carrier protein] reductase II